MCSAPGPDGCVGQFGTWFDRPGWTYDGGPTDGWHRHGNTVLETGQNVDNGNPPVTVCPVAENRRSRREAARYPDMNGITDARIDPAAAGHAGGLGPVVGMTMPMTVTA